MSYVFGKSDNFMNLLNELYSNDEYIRNLNEIKNKMRKIHSITTPQFDDIEAEIVCLLIMHTKPKLIHEFSPCGGWSSLYMLNTLEFISDNSKLVSFDIVDKCTSNINCVFPQFKNKFEFHLGNVEEKYTSFTEDIDYLFIDSDHSAEFTKRYIDNLLIPLLLKLRKINKKIFVSVHDVFHSEIPSEEGVLVIDFLEKNNIEYFSPLHYEHCETLSIIRNNNTILDKSEVHYATTNPCIYFILG